ncbi:MFS transporter [Phaeodactylibacter xiamenensis]|jgi:MFS family permease|uniref:MFS transporter n=1 Tax=Phaeodactylibacter xiamenensis TaxID=1524460 RepID=UPI0024A8CC67|nr:MFS transporter [Phaeodactylibacter xiamenensis]
MIKTLKTFAFHLPSLSVGLTFFTLSMLFGSWLARLPEVQARLMLSEGQLGLALLGLPVGALLMMPLAGWLSARLSSGQAMTLSTLLFCGVFPLPAFAQGPYSLFAGLLLIGFVNSFMNISMNAAAAAVERHYHIAIMSVCHGMFSLGAMVGAGSSGLIASLGVSLQVHLITVALLMVGLHLLLRPVIHSLPSAPAENNGLSIPPRALLGLAFIGFCIMIGEGAIADWSAIFLRKELQAGPFIAGLAYAGFSMAMAIGRFMGDGIRLQLGLGKAVTMGSLLGAAGLLLAILAPLPVLSVLGFTIVGLGFSTVVPLLFSAAANTPGVSAGNGIAAVASSGVIGFLVAPPLIGLISDHFGLALGLGFVVVLAVLASVTARSIKA